jgi:hypothetical protein
MGRALCEETGLKRRRTSGFGVVRGAGPLSGVRSREGVSNV